jgi:hypothetical protein
MKRAFLLGMMLSFLPREASPATDCRVVAYPDHYEAICDGDPAQARAAPNAPAPRELAAREQIPPDLQVSQGQQDADGESPIVRGGLGGKHMEYWLNTQPRH